MTDWTDSSIAIRVICAIRVHKTSDMRILVTGAKGFVGKNLCAQLNNIKEGKARCYGDLKVEEVFEYDLDSTPEQLDRSEERR